VEVGSPTNNMATQPLPPLPSLPLEPGSMEGPTNSSNWVVKGLVLCGENPGSLDLVSHVSNMALLANVGITTFVCLQQAKELTRMKSYIDDYREQVSRLSSTETSVSFLHFPIEDGGEADDDAQLLEFVKNLASHIEGGQQRLYIHCWAGRGRTGIVVAILLGILYNIPAGEALKRTQLYFDQRTVGWGDSPEYLPQRTQVFRVLDLYYKKKPTGLSITLEK